MHISTLIVAIFAAGALSSPVSLKPPTTASLPTAKLVARASPISGGVSIIDTINKWRGLYHVGTLTWSDQLAANAHKTGKDDGGVNENHELNPGSYAQVIAPGALSFHNQDLKGDTPFEVSYVAFFCEVPSDAQLHTGTNQCALVKSVLNFYYTETGHHDVLVNPDYKSIGCAFTHNPNAQVGSPYQGLWICDLGF